MASVCHIHPCAMQNLDQDSCIHDALNGVSSFLGSQRGQAPDKAPQPLLVVLEYPST